MNNGISLIIEPAQQIFDVIVLHPFEWKRVKVPMNDIDSVVVTIRNDSFRVAVSSNAILLIIVTDFKVELP
ncbi:hypothetical protein D3C73_1486590 [compost metagenome]